jgi:hypothetical protein
MTSILRMRVGWSGSLVTGPGVSTLYCSATASAGWPAATSTLFANIKGVVPTGITFDIPSVVDELDLDTGELLGAYTLGGGGTQTSSGGAVDYKPGVGLRIRWGTNGVVGGRRVSGTTFVCPIISSAVPNGVVDSSQRSVIASAGAAYIAAAGFTPMVYSPKVENNPDPKGKNRPGAQTEITSCSVPVQMTWLRSRRT